MIENDDLLAEGLARSLRSAGYQTIRVSDGAAGLRAAMRRRLDAIVLDLNLSGLDGFCVLLGLRAARVHSPIVVLGGLQDPADQQRALLSGAAAYLVKTKVRASDVLAALQKAMH